MDFAAHENAKGVRIIQPKTQAVGTLNGTGVDCKGFRELLTILDLQIFGAASTLDFKLQESNDDGATDAYADVPSSAMTQLATAGGNNKLVLHSVDLEQRKRFIRGVLVLAGNTTDVSVAGVLMNPVLPPVTPFGLVVQTLNLR